MSKRSNAKRKELLAEQVTETMVEVPNTTIETSESVVEATIDENRKDLDAARKSAYETIKNLPTKSAQIRALAAQGYPTKEISKILGILYQHARNVLITPLKPRKNKDINKVEAEAETAAVAE